VVAVDVVGAWLVLGFWLPIPVPSVKVLENESMVLKVDELASLEALTAPVADEESASGDVVDVEGLTVDIVAAPGPSPNAGTLPTCFEVATLVLWSCEVEVRYGLLDGSGTAADVDV